MVFCWYTPGKMGRGKHDVQKKIDHVNYCEWRVHNGGIHSGYRGEG